MVRPCYNRKINPHPVPVPEVCHLCRYYLNNARYRALWGPDPDGHEGERPRAAGPYCAHWGVPLGAYAAGCFSCPLHACAVHGRCTLRPTGEPGLANCEHCKDGVPREGPIPREVKFRSKKKPR